jgi:hypothetical protein
MRTNFILSGYNYIADKPEQKMFLIAYFKREAQKAKEQYYDYAEFFGCLKIAITVGKEEIKKEYNKRLHQNDWALERYYLAIQRGETTDPQGKSIQSHIEYITNDKKNIEQNGYEQFHWKIGEDEQGFSIMLNYKQIELFEQAIIQAEQELTSTTANRAGLKTDELLNLNICDFIEHLHRGDLIEFEMNKWIEHNCTSDEQLLLLHSEIESCVYVLDENKAGSLPYVKFLLENRNPKLFKDGYDGHNGRDTHFTRAFTTDEHKKLFANMKKNSFLPANTNEAHFKFVFGNKDIPENETPFKPLQWAGTIKELHYFIRKHLTKETNQWEKAVKCFEKDTKPINKDSLSTAIDKYDTPPDSSTIIDSLLD